MTRVGILLHCRNLSTNGWEELVFGLPQEQKLGDIATLLRAILTLPKEDEVVKIVIGRGPSVRDGLDEGEYTKQFLLDHVQYLDEFDVLRPLLNAFTTKQKQHLHEMLEDAVLTPTIQNTREETAEAARIFNDVGLDKVIEVSAASHAPRCLKEQAVLRSKAGIDPKQLWVFMATDMSYKGTTPEDITVIEPLHRLDQPLTFVHPGISDVIRPYYTLDDEEKKAFIKTVGEFMTERNHLP